MYVLGVAKTLGTKVGKSSIIFCERTSTNLYDFPLLLCLGVISIIYISYIYIYELI